MSAALASRLSLFVVLSVGIPLAPAIACEDGHWIQEALADGRILKLEDGSLWRVDSIDTITSALWLPMSDVIVCDDTIVNVDDGETVHVHRIR
jgi:hypothetical protein